MRGKGGVVSAAVVHVENEGRVQGVRLQLALLTVRAQNVEQILRKAAMVQRRYNI